MTKRTIAIRECDGIYDCCMKAVEGFRDYAEFSAKLNEHAGKHREFICRESYLQSLWTLQECLLSHTIQFVVGHNNQPTKRRGDEGFHNLYKDAFDHVVAKDSMWVLAFSLKGSEGVAGISEFLQAYVHGGTVMNSKSSVRGLEEDIHTGNFLSVNLASSRSATLPRDYIFATMPQFPWYQQPENAIGMSFGEIYMDLYQQAANANHAFTCRFSRSMLDPEAIDPIESWLPSKHLPSPSCLGDFLKLVGHRVPDVPNGKSQHVHLTSVVKVQEFCCRPGPNWTLATLESSMHLFRHQWDESHRGGELSKFGSYSETSWSLDYPDAMRCGWLSENPREVLRVLEDGGETVISLGPGLDYAEDNFLQNLYGLSGEDGEVEGVNAGYVPLFQQARMVLAHMWETGMQKDDARKTDWDAFKREMRASWSTPLLRTMLLCAAMIVCRIPLSATAWVNRIFVPVYVQYGESLMMLGLLTKHARQGESDRKQCREIYSVGQHLPHKSEATKGSPFGKDHFLVEPSSKVPVGILPDFLPDIRTDAEYTNITSVLYDGLCSVSEGHVVGIITAPLHLVRGET